MKLLTICIYLAFYIICGYATTDILRLLKGSSVDLWYADCFCPVCGHKIRLIHQIPILSYFICNGKCSDCGSKIPASELFMECFIFTVLSAAITVCRFSQTGCILSFFLYETIKFCYLFTHGIRKTHVAKNLLFSLYSNLILWTLIALLIWLRSIVTQ